MNRRPPRWQRAAFRFQTRPQPVPLVARHGTLLPELTLGDLVKGRTKGAGTAAHATDFNFIPRARIVAVSRRPGRQLAD